MGSHSRQRSLLWTVFAVKQVQAGVAYQLSDGHSGFSPPAEGQMRKGIPSIERVIHGSSWTTAGVLQVKDGGLRSSIPTIDYDDQKNPVTVLGRWLTLRKSS